MTTMDKTPPAYTRSRRPASKEDWLLRKIPTGTLWRPWLVFALAATCFLAGRVLCDPPSVLPTWVDHAIILLWMVGLAFLAGGLVYVPAALVSLYLARRKPGIGTCVLLPHGVLLLLYLVVACCVGKGPLDAWGWVALAAYPVAVCAAGVCL